QDALGIDLSKPTIGLLTNVIWDAQLHYRANAFGSMMEWILATIDYFTRRTDLQLVIRVHPAEIRGTVPSRQRVTDEIGRLRGSCPANVFVIPPESPVSTYAVMDRCNAVLIYGTKTGVELSARGTPVIVGGEAWIRNKGLTLDAASPEEYLALLDRLPLAGRLDDATVTRARKYAYHFFFRRMIPIAAMKPTGEWPPYRMSVKTLAELEPGRDRGLDVVCDGILDAQPFVY
ncbi:MAG: capsular biosynthesis protein, partial [Myxococcota bacterium]